MSTRSSFFFFFFFNDTATTEIYTLSLHDALPILQRARDRGLYSAPQVVTNVLDCVTGRSEEHTSELQSRLHLVCRLLLEKKKTKQLSRTPLISTDHNYCLLYTLISLSHAFVRSLP